MFVILPEESQETCSKPQSRAEEHRAYVQRSDFGHELYVHHQGTMTHTTALSKWPPSLVAPPTSS